MPTIKITCSPDGYKIDADGFVGGSCFEATKLIEKLGDVTETKMKPEFYQQKTELVRGKL